MTNAADFNPGTNRDDRLGSTGTPYRTRSFSRDEANNEASPASDCPNVLARNTEFSGTIEVTDSIRLEGKFKGEVWTQGTLHVVPEANVQAKVQANYVVIGGTFKGEVTCDKRVDLLAQCRASGKLSTGGLSVEEGAIFDGEVAMTRKPSTTPRREETPEATSP